MTSSAGPFEDFGDEQVTTFPCPACDALHSRAEYEEIGEDRRLNQVVKIYRCPKGHEVQIDMHVTLPVDNEAIYVELHPSEKPSG